MKTSYFIYAITLWLVCLLFCSVAEQQNLIGSTQMGQLQTLIQPIIAENSSLISAVFAYVTNAGEYVKTIINILFLYFPTLWTGTWLWFWVILLLPVSCSMVITLVLALRGTSSQ